MALLDPKEVTVKTQKGDERKYILSHFPAAAGREIIVKYPLSSVPKLSDYGVNEETMYKLMCYVGVPIEGKDEPLLLTTKALVDNHVPDWETLARIEIGMIEYNTSFFGNGVAATFLEAIAQKAPAWITRMLTDFLQPLLQKIRQASTN